MVKRVGSFQGTGREGGAETAPSAGRERAAEDAGGRGEEGEGEGAEGIARGGTEPHTQNSRKTGENSQGSLIRLLLPSLSHQPSYSTSYL